MPEPIRLNLAEIQPSQLYICREKLAAVMATRPASLQPIPVVRLGGRIVCTDGHTRAFAAWQAGLAAVAACWETESLDWEAYQICVDWCRREGIFTISDLAGRVVSTEEYESLWYERCRRMHRQLRDG